MKKIPTLFERIFKNHNKVGITDKVTEGMEWVLNGEGVATVKWDGACCAIINGELYKRYDAKRGKKPPEGAIPCCEPDSVTGHWPHWVKVDVKNPADKWFVEALKNTPLSDNCDGTYEAIGLHFNGNPYKKLEDTLIPHGYHCVDVPRTFEGIKKYLKENYIEGIVFWKDGEPQCKIKRSDFLFEWGSGSAPITNPFEWHNAKTDPPKEKGRYLCAYRLFNDRMSCNIYDYAHNLESIDKYDFKGKRYGGWYNYDSEYGYWEATGVMYWMPLPELPKESDSNG